MGAIAPTLQNLRGRRHYFRPHGFLECGGDRISCLCCVYWCMFGMLVSIISVDCIQRVIQCVQGPPELLWLRHALTPWGRWGRSPHAPKPLGATPLFSPHRFLECGGDRISCLCCVYWCMFGVLVRITSIDCIQRVIQCVQGPPKLLLDTIGAMVLTTDSQIKYLAAVIVFFSCAFYGRPMV